MLIGVCILAMGATNLPPADAPDVDSTGDVPVKWSPTEPHQDFDTREVMIPMRDGVRLHTLIVTPRAARDFPILLERTPYKASKIVSSERGEQLRDAVWPGDWEWAGDGYIFVSQDVRGKYGSEGVYVMTRPPIGPLNGTNTDDTTDAYDTIDWLVKNVAESNGRVGMIGSSYDGWAVAMALLGPHPALKVAAAESPMIDGWMGDDWFHYGAFRQVNMDYFTEQTSQTNKGTAIPRAGADDYENFLEAGSAGEYAKQNGLQQLPFWNRLSAHPAYDSFWQAQALDVAIAAKPSAVPTIWLQGLWDQEDIYGAIHTWEKLRDGGNGRLEHLVVGPWFHSQVNGSASQVGPLALRGDTAHDFRRKFLIPFFDTYLKDKKKVKPLPPALIYDVVENQWDEFDHWPGTAVLTPLFLQSQFGLSFLPSDAGQDSYVSDPAKPVPFLQPPLKFKDRSRWATWLLEDQRFVSTRTDVLSYKTDVLKQDVRIEGSPFADLYATTTGSDGDFVVKIIDVYPPSNAQYPAMAGYQLPISMDIFRGRYRASFEFPSPITPGSVQEYKFRLPTANYVFKSGHRIMVQIQSSLFPLYDRNPQTYVQNIFFTKPADYQKATVSIEHNAYGQSAVLLPIVQNSSAIDSHLGQSDTHQGVD